MTVLIDTSKPPVMPQPVGGPRWAWNREDLKKIAVGLVVAMVGAGLTYLTEKVGSVDFGEWTPFVVAGVSVAVNALRKLLGDPMGGIDRR